MLLRDASREKGFKLGSRVGQLVRPGFIVREKQAGKGLATYDYDVCESLQR